MSKVKDTLFERDYKNGITAVITDNPIVDDEEGNYFFVFLDERQYSTSYSIGDIVPYPTDLEAIHTKLKKQEDYERMEEERILRAAVYFLEPYFFRKGELFRVEELLDLVRQMCIVDENVRDTNDMPDVFIRYLFEWQAETSFSKICDLEAGVEAQTDSDETIFYDAKNVYVTEKMFKKIVKIQKSRFWLAPSTELSSSKESSRVKCLGSDCLTLGESSIKAGLLSNWWVCSQR